MAIEQQQKEQLLAQINKWHEEDAFQAIIERLEPEIVDLDYDLALALARAYINAANASGSGDMSGTVGESNEFYAQANALLDKYILQGKEHATYLFYKGFALFKLGLINDAAIRLERAKRFIQIGNEDSLLPTINNLLSLCSVLDADNQSMQLSAEDEALIDEHIKKHFGSYRIIFKTDRYELLNVPPSEEHNFNLIITKGLAGKQLKVPAGVDPLTDSRLELAICLPAAWEFTNTESYNLWPLNVLCDLINYILCSDGENGEFVGFGYTFDQGKPLHSSTDFSGGMLTALGAYPRNSSEVVLSDQSRVHFFELVLLFPMELSFRQSHSAYDLLDLFQQKHVAPSPVRKRQDVCVQVNATTKI